MTVHNRRETTLKCLECLAGSVFADGRIDIFITDDGSTDGTAGAILDLDPSIHIIAGNGSLFWNRGMYQAWAEAEKDDYDYYWWVNDDTFVFKDTLSRMIQCSINHSDQAIIVGSTAASNDSTFITYGGWRDGALITDLTREQTCETMNGNLVIVPRFVFKFLGRNDPYYHHALGDLDYGLRAKDAGLEIFTAPGVLGVCDLHENMSLWMDPSQPFHKRWNHFFSPLGNNPFEYFHFRRRHFGWWAAVGTFISNFLHLFFPSLWMKRNKHTL